jgi:hypothetical protein
MTTPTIERLYAALLSLLTERIATEPVILGARTGMGSPALARELLRRTNGFMLDPLAAGGDSELLTQTLTRNVIDSLQPLPLEALDEPGREAEQARVQLARHYDGDLAPALAAATSAGEAALSDWTITRALGPSPGNPLLAVRDAHRLPSTIMWELRELASTSIRLLLLTNPEHHPQLNGKNASFYGMSAYIEMPTLSLADWRKALGDQLPVEALRELLGITRSRTAITLEVLERHTKHHGESAIDFAFLDAVDARNDQAREVLNLARSVHELAPRLLLALAAGQAPYGIHNERSDRVALALRHLRDYGLIEQPRPRTWQIADPLLSTAIARLWNGQGREALLLTSITPLEGSTINAR